MSQEEESFCGAQYPSNMICCNPFLRGRQVCKPPLLFMLPSFIPFLLPNPAQPLILPPRLLSLPSARIFSIIIKTKSEIRAHHQSKNKGLIYIMMMMLYEHELEVGKAQLEKKPDFLVLVVFIQVLRLKLESFGECFICENGKMKNFH